MGSFIFFGSCPSFLDEAREETLATQAGKHFVAGFAKNESLYRRIVTKYKWSKLIWRILEDNKQNKLENWGKKTVRINLCVQTTHTLRYSSNAANSFPLSFLPLKPCKFDDFYQEINVCSFLTDISMKNWKIKRLFKQQATRWRHLLNFIMLISFNH